MEAQRIEKGPRSFLPPRKEARLPAADSVHILLENAADEALREGALPVRLRDEHLLLGMLQGALRIHPYEDPTRQGPVRALVSGKILDIYGVTRESVEKAVGLQAQLEGEAFPTVTVLDDQGKPSHTEVDYTVVDYLPIHPLEDLAHNMAKAMGNNRVSDLHFLLAYLEKSNQTGLNVLRSLGKNTDAIKRTTQDVIREQTVNLASIIKSTF